MNKPVALIVDDEPAIRELLNLTLTRMDVACVLAGSLEEARGLLRSQAVYL